MTIQSQTSDGFGTFLAAIGGAVLGMLLTLLVLAVINGGTLSFQNNNEDLMEDIQHRIHTDENLDELRSRIKTVEEQLGIVSDLSLADPKRPCVVEYGATKKIIPRNDYSLPGGGIIILCFYQGTADVVAVHRLADIKSVDLEGYEGELPTQ